MRTYGTAVLDKGVWHVKAEPHVAIRLRRLFKKAGRQVGVVKLAATDEVSRDLQWFAQRYPLEFKPREVLDQKAAAYDRRVEDFDAVLSGRRAPRPFEMAIPPRDYQRVAAELGLQAGGLLIADDVGLGKTASSIAMLTEPATRPALVVTLTHLPRQWESELARFAPTLRVHRIRKGTPYDLTQRRRARCAASQLAMLSAADMAPPLPDVLVINYHKLGGWAETLAGKLRTIIFDEVQELRRGGGTLKYDAAKLIADQCHYRVGLSATPIYNYGVELFNVLEVLRPGALGSRSEFLEEWCKGHGGDPAKARITAPKAFGTYVRDAGLMIRRTRADVRRELPPLTRSVLHVDCDEKELERLSRGVAELAQVLLEQGGAWDAKGQAAREIDWRLRHATGIAKAPFVADFVRLMVDSGERVVLYGWHHDVYDIWRDRLSDIPLAFYTGKESPTAKDAAKAAFVEGKASVLVMSLRAGAGLDGLQGSCRTIVHGELDWSPGVHEQADGRVHRDGQGDPVFSYFPVADSGSDPVLMDVLGLKREQIDGIRDPNAPLVEALTTDHDRVKKLAEAYLARKGSGANG